MAQPPDTGSVEPKREALLGVLAQHRVMFVLIGGAAIQSHGRRYDTLDIDLTPSTDEENLTRLAAALNELDCQLVTDPADIASWVALPSDYFTSRALLAASVWNLATRHGQLDITFTPAGFPGGYQDLALRAILMPAAGTTIVISVAALDDVHESKRQANRPKDREYLQRAEPQ